MKPYYDMLNQIFEEGEVREDRTGVGTKSLFGVQARYRNIRELFPLDTTRKMPFENIVHELLWFLSGNTNIRYLVQNNVSWWSAWPLKHYNQSMKRFNLDGEDRTLTRSEFEGLIRSNPQFAEEWGDCGPIYGQQWVNWQGNEVIAKNIPDDVHSWHESKDGTVRYRETVNQIANLIQDLKNNPLSRRHIVSAWNVADIPAMIPSGLPPCHVMFQFYCRQLTHLQRLAFGQNLTANRTEYLAADGYKRTAILDEAGYPKYKLDCQLYQRSADSVLGVPSNIASYSLLTMMIAQQVNMIPGDFIHTIGDAHIYLNHLESIKEQLNRRPYPAPTVSIKRAKDIFSYTIDDFELENYSAHPAIRYKIAI